MVVVVVVVAVVVVVVVVVVAVVVVVVVVVVAGWYRVGFALFWYSLTILQKPDTFCPVRYLV